MKTISRKRFHSWWILLIAGAVAAALLLPGCTVDREGNAAIETPKASVALGKTGYTLYGYGVFGVSHFAPETSPK